MFMLKQLAGCPLRRTLTVLCLVVFVQTLAAQEVTDYTALAQPSFGDRLGLSDAQRAQIATILDERVNALVNTNADERAQVLVDSNNKLESVLTEDQQQTFAALVEGGKLRFNFRQQDWPDVLDWFARQADLSLVMDTAPPGKFTYSDTKNYTPAQSIDLLNSVLLSKGFTLIRREQMLIVVETSDGIPYDLLPRVTVEELAQRGRFEFVSVLFPLGAKPVEAVLSEVQALIGKHGRATPLPQTKQLLVVETAGTMQAINVLIASIPEPKKKPDRAPEPKPPAPVFSVYPAKGLETKAAVETLQRLFKEAKLTPDPNAEQIHVYATPPQQTAIKAAIQQMTANVAGDNQPRLEIYPIVGQELSHVQTLVAAAVPKVQISLDESQHRLLVVANAQQQEDVRKTLEKLDAVENGAATVVVYEVELEATDKIVSLLQPILPRAHVVSQPGRIAVRGRPDQQQLASQTIEQLQIAEENLERPALKFYALQAPLDHELLSALQQLVPAAAINPLDGGSRLSAVAKARDHELIAATIQQIESDLAQQEKRTLKFYPVTKQQKERFQTIQPNLQQELESVRLIMDASPQEIAAWATPGQHVAFAQILEGLRRETDEAALELQRFDIDLEEPQRLLGLLREKYPDTQILLTEQQDAVLVWADSDQRDEFNRELDSLVALLPAKKKRTLKVYPAQEMTIDEMQALLTPVMGTAKINPDSSRKRLIIWATDEEHAQITSTLSALQAEDTANYQKKLEIYDVPEFEASTILAAVKELAPGAQSSLDRNERRLIVIATPDQHQLIAQLVEKVAPDPARSTPVLIAYALDRSDPDVVVEMLQELRPNVRFAADTRANRILVTAPLVEQPRLQAVIEQLDADPGRVSEDIVKPYPLKTTDPERVVELLQPLVPDMRLAPDRRARQLMAVGSEFDHQKLQRALSRINEDASKLGTVQTYDVGDAEPEQVRNVLMQLVPEAIISTDNVAKRVLVWAVEVDHSAVKQALEQFTGPSTDEPRQLKSYRLPEGMGEVILSVIKKIAPAADMDVDRTQGELICWGTDKEQQAVAQAMEELYKSQARREDVRLQVYEARRDIGRIAPSLIQDIAPEARVVDDGNDSRLSLWATDKEHQAIAELIQTLNDQLDRRTAASEIKAYQLDRDDLATARQLITDEAENARFLNSSDARRLVIQATAEEHAAIARMLQKLEQATKLPGQIVRIYPIDRKRIQAQTVVDALDAELTQDSSIQVNASTNSLIIRATEEAHKTLKSAIDSIVTQLPVAPEVVTTVYRFENADPNAAVAVLETLVPEARFAVDQGSGSLAATALPDDHRSIQRVVNQMDAVNGSARRVTRIYRLTKASARRVAPAFSAMVSDGAVTYDSESNSLVIAASTADHERIQQTVDDLNGGRDEKFTTKVYALKLADPRTIQAAITPLVREATVTSDRSSGTLIVSASDPDHQRVADVVEQLDTVSGQQPVMRAYAIRNADAKLVHESVSSAFARSRSFSITFQDTTKTLFVVATPQNHVVFAELMKELDQPTQRGEPQFAKVYPLANVDGAAAQSALTALFQNQLPAVKVELDELGNALIVVATNRQHETVSQSLQQLDGSQRELEVFELQFVDPFVVENAVLDLFVAVPPGTAPSVSTDYGTQKLFVRGSKNQIDQIRQLLVKMGETFLVQRAGGQRGDVRTIPFKGDTSMAVRRIERIWPRLRTNRIQVVTPAESAVQPIKPGLRAFDGDEKSGNPQPNEDTPDNVMRWKDRVTAAENIQFVTLQQSTRSSEPNETDADKKGNAGQDTGPAIVMIPSDDRITIASSDHEALDQLESLLRAMARTAADFGTNSNFAVFLLRNTGASDVHKLLTDLFKELPVMRGGIGDIALVADERLNALVVHGSRKDRELIEELLRVLDSEDLPNPIAVFQPELVPLQNTEARRVLLILENVYKAQMSTGGGRKSVDIPAGVSSEVASVLQQINAAAAAPVLTLDVDETTNSIVMRAPPELRQEIKAFVQNLDIQATKPRNRSVRVIRLRQSKADRMQAVLEEFILQ